ncbi:MAG: DMT family transporter [Candidatus Heimdallarchaeota archaeon]|nr:DMT family transporter [Candidatus Heimdallarchaeota archaeon]
MNITVIGEILAVASVLCFVTSNVIFRRIDKFVSPSQINSFRTIVGVITYLLLTLILWKIQLLAYIPAMTWMWLILSFIFGQVAGDTAFFKAQELLGTTIALAISMTFPLMTTVLYILILKQHIPYYFYISLFLLVIGVSFIAIGKNRQDKNLLRANFTSNNNNDDDLDFSQDSQKEVISDESIISLHDASKKSKKVLIIGISVGLIAALAWSFGAVLTDKAFNEVKAVLELASVENADLVGNLLGNLIRFPIAAGILSALTVVNKKQRIKEWSKHTWLFLILGAIIGTSIGAFLYTEAIVLSNAAIVAIIGSSSPLFSLPISWLINREKSNWLSIIGVIVTFVGVLNIFLWEIFCSSEMIMC